MKQTKYRVRVKKGNRWDLVAYEAIIDNRWHWRVSEEDKWMSGVYPGEGVRDQFTGLKDEGGTAIYLCDTLRLALHATSDSTVHFEAGAFVLINKEQAAYPNVSDVLELADFRVIATPMNPLEDV